MLNSDVLAQSNGQQVLQRAGALQREYEDELSPAFPLQMVCFRTSMQAEISKLHSITELAHTLILESASVTSGFADIVKGQFLDFDAVCDCCNSREVLLKVENN